MELEKLSDRNGSIMKAGASSMWPRLALYITSVLFNSLPFNKTVRYFVCQDPSQNYAQSTEIINHHHNVTRQDCVKVRLLL